MAAVSSVYISIDSHSSTLHSLILKSSSPFSITSNELSANVLILLEKLNASSNHSFIELDIIPRRKVVSGTDNREFRVVIETTSPVNL